MNFVKKFLKWIGIGFGGLIALLIVVGIFSDPPKEHTSKEVNTQVIDNTDKEIATNKELESKEEPKIELSDEEEDALEELADFTLDDYRNNNSFVQQDAKENHKLVDVLIKTSKIFDSDNSKDVILAKNCISEYAFTKSAELKLKDVFKWCETDKDIGKDDFEKRINLDKFFGNFMIWGAYIPLEQAIKDSMNNPDSYEHVQTKYAIKIRDENNKGKSYAVIITKFRGTNVYNAIVTQEVKAIVDLETNELAVVE